MRGPAGRIALIVGVVASAASLWLVDPAAGDFFGSRRRTENRGSLPPFAYGHDGPSDVAVTLATARAGQPQEVPRPDRRPMPNDASPGDTILRKRFTVDDSDLTAGPVRLSRISLATYETGEFTFTGLIAHDGGPHGDLLGNNVTLRVRAYAGVAGYPTVQNNASVLWETTRSLWIRRTELAAISLAPGTARTPSRNGDWISFTAAERDGLGEEVRRHFQATTHIEIEVQCHRSR